MRVPLFLQNKTNIVLLKDLSEVLEQKLSRSKDISEAL